MAEQPGFWSAEGFPYPLLALGQTFPRGYQYQSQMTPYKRSARGDWGRALNESMDQFFAMWPQYMQQKRQFALQRNQLARQKTADLHQAKLRPYELKEAQAKQQVTENRMKMLKNYPTMVESLPVSEKIKAHLLTLPPTEGLDRMKTIMTHQFKPKTRLIKAGTPIDGQTYSVDLQQKDDGTLMKVPARKLAPATADHPLVKALVEMVGQEHVDEFLPFMQIDTTYSAQGELIMPQGMKGLQSELQKVALEERDPSETQKFKAKHEANNFVNIGAFADLAPYAGSNVEAQKSFARIHLPEGHALRERADLDLAENLVAVDPKDPRLEDYLPGEIKHLKMHKYTKQLHLPPGFKLREKFASVPDTDPRIEKYPPALRKYLRISNINNELSFPPAFTKELQDRALALDAPSRSELFKTRHAASKYANIRALGDLAEVAGNTLNGQRIAAVQLLPEDHVVRQRAQYDLTQAGVKMGRNGVFIPEPFRGQRRATASAPQSIPVEQGNTLDQIVADFKAKGITVDKTQVIAANKHFFPEGDPNKMMTSAELGNAEMLIPVGGGPLSEFEVNAAHRSTDPRHNVTIIPNAGTYTNFNNATVPFAYKLNNDLAEMKKMQSNVDEVVGLMTDPNALGLLETGHPARGLIEGLRWRLINNVQVLRDFGVLSSREIETIAKSIPDINSTFNWAARKIFGLEPERFVKGVLGALKAEGITKANQLRAFMGQYGVQEVDFKIHQYDPYEGLGNLGQSQNQNQGSSSKIFVDSFRE